MMLTKSMISPWAIKYEGIPVVKKGRSFDAVDCYGLHWLIELTEAGIEMPRFDDFRYSAQNTKGISRHIVARMQPWQRIETPRDRCAVLLFEGKEQSPSHIGVICGPGIMLHADDERGVVAFERLVPPVWHPSKIEGYYVYGVQN